MTLADILNLIQGVGFPITMCLALFWYQNKQNDKIFTMFTDMNRENRESDKERNDTLKESIDRLTEAVERSINV